MDQAEVLTELSDFNRKWNLYQKNRVFSITTSDNSDQGFAIFFELLFYKISVVILIGKRFGLSEQVFIVDTRPKTTDIDYLAAASNIEYGLTAETLLCLPDGIISLKKNKNREKLKCAVEIWLEAEVEKLQKEQESGLQKVITFVKDFKMFGGEKSVRCSRYTLNRT